MINQDESWSVIGRSRQQMIIGYRLTVRVRSLCGMSCFWWRHTVKSIQSKRLVLHSLAILNVDGKLNKDADLHEGSSSRCFLFWNMWTATRFGAQAFFTCGYCTLSETTSCDRGTARGKRCPQQIGSWQCWRTKMSPESSWHLLSEVSAQTTAPIQTPSKAMLIWKAYHGCMVYLINLYTIFPQKWLIENDTIVTMPNTDISVVYEHGIWWAL